MIPAGFSVWASQLTATPAEEPGEIPAGDRHVQLASIMAPVLPSGRRQYYTEAITLIVKVPAEDAPTVCTLSPRVVDAVIHELYRQPIPADRKKNLEVAGAEGRLLAPVNQVLGGATVQQLYILPGVHSKHVTERAKQRLPMIEIVGCDKK